MRSVFRSDSNFDFDLNPLVVPGWRVVAGLEHLNTSRYRDDTWIMSSAIGNRGLHLYLHRIEFLKIDQKWREIIKRYLFLCMNFDHSSSDKGWAFSSIAPSAMYIHKDRIIRVLKDLEGWSANLRDLTQEDLDGWLASMRGLSPSSQLNHILVVRRLYLYGDLIPGGNLQFKPWGSATSGRVAGYRLARENKTLRIPEEISAPLLRWALFFVDSGIDDLLSYRDRVYPHRARSRQSPKKSDVQLKEYFEGLSGVGYGLPCLDDGSPDYFAISNESGLSRAVLSARSQLLFDALAVLGPDFARQSGKWSVLPGVGVPWLTSVERHKRKSFVYVMAAACYVVIASLSGMRHDEIASIRIDGLKESPDSPGRFDLEGKILKGSKISSGRLHRWVVIDPVAKAIRALEKINKHIFQAGQIAVSAGEMPLFAPVSGAKSFSSTRAQSHLSLFVRVCNELSNKIAEAHPDASSIVRHLYSIPTEHRGVEWKFSTRQFRRTLAWYIARRPFGVIAGMLQYGHASEIMFEGYAGQSSSGFRAEVEEFEALSQLEDVVSTYEDWLAGVAPGGPMGGRLQSDFERVRRTLGNLQGVVADDQRRDAMLKNIAASLHPGFINDCFFFPEHALCLSDRKAAGAQPIMASCRPASCPNSLVAPRHRSALVECVTDAESVLRRKGLAVPQREAVKHQIEIYKELIGKIPTDVSQRAI